jgi:DNA-binding GntR family transcriptional regulator
MSGETNGNIAEFRKPELLPERIAKFIRDGIVEGTWQPGSRLIESQLAGQLGVSRAPLREALRLLGAEGLVTLTPHRGARVSETSTRELEDLFAVRGELEAFAAELAVHKATAEQIARLHALIGAMEGSFEGSNLAGWYEAGLEFHNILIEAARNAVLSQLYEQVKRQSRRYQAVMARLPALPRDSLEEHRAILAAIERRNPEAARHAARAHISHLARRFLEHQYLDAEQVTGSSVATGEGTRR